MERRAGRHPQLRAHLLRPRRPDGQRFLALGHVQHPGQRDPPGAGRWRPKKPAASRGAIQGRTDYGLVGYGGPCPPPGDKPHRYQFTIFAVDVDKLDANEHATAAVVGFNLHFHTLAKATLTATFGR